MIKSEDIRVGELVREVEVFESSKTLVIIKQQDYDKRRN